MDLALPLIKDQMRRLPLKDIWKAFMQRTKKEGQSHNFIFDLTNCPLEDNEIDRQIDELYRSTHTAFLDKLVLIRGDMVYKVYSRNK